MLNSFWWKPKEIFFISCSQFESFFNICFVIKTIFYVFTSRVVYGKFPWNQVIRISKQIEATSWKKWKKNEKVLGQNFSYRNIIHHRKWREEVEEKNIFPVYNYVFFSSIVSCLHRDREKPQEWVIDVDFSKL